MMAWNRMEKIVTDCDFSLTGVEQAQYEMGKKYCDTGRMLICDMVQSARAGEIGRTLGLEVLVLPAGLSKDEDAWALLGQNSMIWSPGA